MPRQTYAKAVSLWCNIRLIWNLQRLSKRHGERERRHLAGVAIESQAAAWLQRWLQLAPTYMHLCKAGQVLASTALEGVPLPTAVPSREAQGSLLQPAPPAWTPLMPTTSHRYLTLHPPSPRPRHHSLDSPANTSPWTVLQRPFCSGGPLSRAEFLNFRLGF
jgi:hypothetical protein